MAPRGRSKSANYIFHTVVHRPTFRFGEVLVGPLVGVLADHIVLLKHSLSSSTIHRYFKAPFDMMTQYYEYLVFNSFKMTLYINIKMNVNNVSYFSQFYNFCEITSTIDLQKLFVY